MGNRLAFFVSFVIVLAMMSGGASVQAQSHRIDLDSSMITGEGDAGPEVVELVDEAWCFPDGICETSWENWNPGVDYPLSAVLDLGDEHLIDQIHLFDHGGSGLFIVSFGEPGNWTPVIQDEMDGWAWKAFEDLSVHTRYLRFTRTTHGKVAEVVLFGEVDGAAPVRLEPQSVTASHQNELAALLVDGDLGAHWETEWSYPQSAWVVLEFDATVRLDTVRAFTNSANFSGALSIELSDDGQTFSPVVTDLDWGAWGWHETGATGQGRFIRLLYENTAEQGKLGGQNELEVWGWSGGGGPEPIPLRTEFKAVLLHYNPRLGAAQNYVTADEYFGMRDVAALAEDYMSVLTRASGGQVNWTLAHEWVLDEFPPSANPAVTHTPDNFVDHVANNIGYGTGRVDYAAILNDPRFDIVGKVEAGEVDAVWVMPPLNCGFWETAMAGEGAYWINGGPIQGVTSNRKFVVYGFGHSAHQHVGFMLENTGHMIENIFVHHQHDWPKRWMVQTWNSLDLTDPDRELVWTARSDPEYWMLSDGKNYISHWADRDAFLVAPDSAQLGTVHYPPNALYNYGWNGLTEYFSSDSRWQVIGGTGSIDGGRYLLAGRAVLHDGDTPQPSRNFALEVTLEIGAGTGSEEAGVLFRLNAYDADPVSGRGYYAGLDAAGDRLVLAKLDNGIEELASMPMTIDSLTEYPVKVEADGETLRFYVTDMEQADLEINDASFATGGFGLQTPADNAAWFDNLQIAAWADSGALAWHDYPDLSQPPRRVNSTNWGGQHDQWLIWWFEHLPKNPGTHSATDIESGEVVDGLLNSWWPYLFDLNGFGVIAGHNAERLVFPAADREAPGAPVALASQEIDDHSLALYWREPTDNIGVTRYDIVRDGIFLQEQHARIFIDRNVAPGGLYRYEVLARDGSGNVSAPTPMDVTKETFFGVVNGDFEIGDGDRPWFWDDEAFRPASVNFVWEAAGSGRGGSRAVSIENTAGNDSRWNQVIEGLTPGVRYRFSGWVKGSDIVAESVVGANLSVMRDGAWSQSDAGAGTFDWRWIQVEFTAPSSGRVTLQARLGHFGNLASGTAYYDDLVLESLSSVSKSLNSRRVVPAEGGD